MLPFIPRNLFWRAKETPSAPQQWPKIAALLTLTITASPGQVELSPRGIYSSSTASDRNPALDRTFVAGAARVEIEARGIWLNKTIFASPGIVELSAGSLAGGFVKNVLVLASPGKIALSVGDALADSWLSGSVFITVPTKQNWVKWSTIGALDFTILKDNLAGERPLDWKGKVYAIKLLHTKALHQVPHVVVYGENGIATLLPAESAFGMQTISRIGLRSKQAVAGNGAVPFDTVHYVLDRQAQLWDIESEGFRFLKTTFLDYSEYLSELVTPVLSYDPQEQLLYLCDGTRGFVYDPLAKSLGRGPATITGIGVQDGTKYLTSPAAITIPLFELTTDIYDFGTRRGKSIQSVEVGLDTAATMQLSIEYRQKIASAFASTNWYTIDSRAVKPLACYGYEFRFHLKALAAGWVHLDYLRVNGLVHDH